MRGWSTEGRFYLGPWGTCSSEAVVGVRVVTQLGCKRQEESEESLQEDSPERQSMFAMPKKSLSTKSVHYSD